MVPDMSWAAAIALGAIVAPPDAVAATAVLRQLSIPYRMLVILEGESLLNDATALLIYRLAVGAAVAGTSPCGRVAPPCFSRGLAASPARAGFGARARQHDRAKKRRPERHDPAVRQDVRVWILADSSASPPS